MQTSVPCLICSALLKRIALERCANQIMAVCGMLVRDTPLKAGAMQHTSHTLRHTMMPLLRHCHQVGHRVSCVVLLAESARALCSARGVLVTVISFLIHALSARRVARPLRWLSRPAETRRRAHRCSVALTHFIHWMLCLDGAACWDADALQIPCWLLQVDIDEIKDAQGGSDVSDISQAAQTVLNQYLPSGHAVLCRHSFAACVAFGQRCSPDVHC